MIINSARFGEMEIPEDRIITMVKPILGFEHLDHFCLIDQEDLRPFFCLQSIEDANTTFLVVNPILFFPDYRIEVNPKEIADLCIQRIEAVETYVIATIPSDPNDLSVNLQGPILINTDNRFGRQVVLVNSGYGVDHNLLSAINESNPEAKKLEPVGA